MRYCGECGAILGAEALYTRRCPSCGTDIETDGSVVALGDPEVLENPTQAALDHPVSGAPKDAVGQPPRRNPIQPKLAPGVIGLLAVLVLVLAGGSILAIPHLGNGAAKQVASGGTPPSGGNSSAVGAVPGQQTATSTFDQTPIATQSTLSSGTPTTGTPTTGTPTVGTPAGTMTPSPTSNPAQAILSVSPTSFSHLACVAAQVEFTVSNPGGTTLHWSASANVGGYTVSPAVGIIDAGLSEIVTVSGILQSGIVTITAPQAANSPMQVQINCVL